jgi:hypothetical protein
VAARDRARAVAAGRRCVRCSADVVTEAAV